MIRFIISALCPGVQSRRHESFSCEDVRFQCFNHWSTYHHITVLPPGVSCKIGVKIYLEFRIHSNGSCVLRWHVISFILSSSTFARSLELTFRFFKGTGWIGTRTISTNQIEFTKSKNISTSKLWEYKSMENLGKSVARRNPWFSIYGSEPQIGSSHHDMTSWDTPAIMTWKVGAWNTQQVTRMSKEEFGHKQISHNKFVGRFQIQGFQIELSGFWEIVILIQLNVGQQWPFRTTCGSFHGKKSFTQWLRWTANGASEQL